ncbi:30S ribosomal protein S6 [Thermoproteota archaeon]
MRHYDILLIIKPNMGEEDYTKIIDNMKSWIEGNGGEITLLKTPGTQELGYPIEKYTHGYYVNCQFKADNKALDKLKAKLQVTEDILRYLIVTMDSIQPKAVVKTAKVT